MEKRSPESGFVHVRDQILLVVPGCEGAVLMEFSYLTASHKGYPIAWPCFMSLLTLLYESWMDEMLQWFFGLIALPSCYLNLFMCAHDSWNALKSKYDVSVFFQAACWCHVVIPGVGLVTAPPMGRYSTLLFTQRLSILILHMSKKDVIRYFLQPGANL